MYNYKMNCLKFCRLFPFTFLFLLASCSQKGESELQQEIVLKSTGSEIVLPNTLTNVDATTSTAAVHLTCLAGGTVAAPRVRIRKIAINWKGTGKLLPLVLQFKSEDKQLVGEAFNWTFSSAEASTISYFFGQTTDYIASGLGEISNLDKCTPGTDLLSCCYYDISSVPAPKVPPTGTGQVKISGKLLLSALVEATDGTLTPVTKETSMSFIYLDGSLPAK